ncbi:MAG: hypothetical protein NT069_16315 [Planctomycetota bacterium]|nr:hypothetical protein [Planctomycetota bacterium]
MSARIRFHALWILSALVLSFPAFSSAEEVADARRLPKGTVAYFSIRNMAEFRSGFNQSMFGQMLHDPAMQPFLGELHGKVAEGLKHFESEAGFSVEELLSVPQGELSLAVTLGPNAGQFALVTFLDFTGREESFRKVLDRIQRAWAFLIQVPANDSPVKLAPAYAIKGSTLVFTTHTDALRTVLTRWDGQHSETFADNETFKYIADRCQNEGSESAPLGAWFIDPLSIVKGALSSDPQMAFQAAVAMGVVQQVGVDKFRGIGGSFDMVRGDFDGVSHTFMYIEPTPRGVMNVMQFDDGALGPPAWVASDVGGFSSTRWNLEKAYTTVESLVDMFAGPGRTARTLDDIAQNAETGRLHLKKDLVDQLTGSYQSFSDQVGEGAAARQRMLLALELRNATSMKGVLARIAAIEGFPGKQREFQGETLYEISIPANALQQLGVPNLTQLQAGGGGADDGDSSVGIAVVEKRLMIAFDVTALEQVIRGLGDRERLSDSAVYKKVASRFPARAASIGFNRGDLQFKQSLEVFKSGMLEQALSQQMDFNLDFTKLPDFEALKKYTSPTGSYMEVDPKGLRWTSFSLKGD